MNTKTPLLLLLLCGSLACGAQDKIYKKDGTIVDVRIKAIDHTTIIYYLPNARKQYTYTLLRSEVDKIVYENGNTEAIGGKDGEAKTVAADTSARDMPRHRKEGKNIMSVIPASYTQQFVSEMTMDRYGVGVCYERIFDVWGGVGICMPAMINFHATADISAGAGKYYDYYLAPGVHLHRGAGYHVIGIAAFYIDMNLPFPPRADGKTKIMGLQLSNSLALKLGTFRAEAELVGGIPFIDDRFKGETVGTTSPRFFLQGNIKFGVRF